MNPSIGNAMHSVELRRQVTEKLDYAVAQVHAPLRSLAISQAPLCAVSVRAVILTGDACFNWV